MNKTKDFSVSVDKTYQRKIQKYEKYDSKISLSCYEPAVSNQNIETCLQMQEVGECREKDKSDRATIEQVIDPKTRLILCRLIHKGILELINGCISTGKEANVYHSQTPNGDHCAIKIYKTSVLVFRDREKYVIGDYRFRRGYRKRNPTQMVRLWAEKEFRNLIRLQKAKIRSPKPILLNSHVLLMEFMGKDGWPTQTLQKARVCDIDKTYKDCVRLMYQIYNVANLVHADLSEFNMLYDNSSELLTVIDVSQAVEHDHPNAFHFLRKDCKNVTHFFYKSGANVMSLTRLFDFIIKRTVAFEDGYKNRIKRNLNETVSDDYMTFLDVHLENLIDSMIEESFDQDIGLDDTGFIHDYLPRTLHDVVNLEDENEQDRLQKSHLFDNKNIRDLSINDDQSENSNVSKSSCLNTESDDDTFIENVDKIDLTIIRPRGEDLASKKERKNAARLIRKEKLKTKVPKYIKKKKSGKL
ncbi:hypothetical protein A3Q56_02774 [Intoshia linei]|uniref:Serine/threonine-protein kinase RIO1 n=1 Tax=Intoshia linei TaxID=1819745 RepID=A0A177B5R2_9BILA|nr:hypothetical protein A3Q56_02774 [Intoshia linei]